MDDFPFLGCEYTGGCETPLGCETRSPVVSVVPGTRRTGRDRTRRTRSGGQQFLEPAERHTASLHFGYSRIYARHRQGIGKGPSREGII